MKQWPIWTAAIVGLAIGFLCNTYANLTAAIATSPTLAVGVVIVLFCPVIYVSWWNVWLVPILNGLLYGGIAFAISKWRVRHRISRQPS